MQQRFVFQKLIKVQDESTYQIHIQIFLYNIYKIGTVKINYTIHYNYHGKYKTLLMIFYHDVNIASNKIIIAVIYS